MPEIDREGMKVLLHLEARLCEAIYTLRKTQNDFYEYAKDTHKVGNRTITTTVINTMDQLVEQAVERRPVKLINSRPISYTMTKSTSLQNNIHSAKTLKKEKPTFLS